MTPLIQNIIRFGLILGIQIILLREVEVHDVAVVWGISLFKPFFYLLFLLMLPANLPRWATLLISFFTGFVVDKYSQTPGLHATACVLFGFVRPFILGRFFQSNIIDMKKSFTPSLSKMGFRNFFIYIMILLTLTIFYYYVIEFWSLRFSDILKMLLKVVSCLFTTVVLVILSQVLFINTGVKRKKR